MKIDLTVSGDMAATDLRGGEKHALAVAACLTRRGHAATIIGRGGREQTARFELDGVSVVNLARVSPPRLLWRLGPCASVGRLAKAYKAENRKPELILSFSPWWTLAGRKALRSAAVVQVVADVLAASTAYERGRRFRFTRLAWLAGGLNSWIERRAYRKADGSIVSSALMRDALVAGGVAADSLAVARPAGLMEIGETADPSGAWRSGHGIPPGAMVVLSCGALTRRKNHAALIRAMVDQQADVYAVIAGDGPLAESLKRLARKLGVADRVIFTGWLADMRPCYAAADVLCHCASFETYGLIYVEAMAFSLALLGPANDPPRCWSSAGELFRPGVDGLLYNAADRHDLGRCVARLAGDRRLLATLKLGAAQRAAAYSWDGYTDALLQAVNNWTGLTLRETPHAQIRRD